MSLPGDPAQDGRGREVGWHVLPFLLGVEAALPLVWEVSGVRYDVDGWFLPTSVLLALAPVLTVLVALRLGSIDRRPEVVRWLVGLALVGPVLLALSLLLDTHLSALSPMVATPASIGAAAGLVGGLRSRAGRASLLFVGGAILGFVVSAWTLIELGIGSLGVSLPEENITAASIIAEVILVCFVLPALGAGIVLGHRVRDRMDPRAVR